MKSPPPPPHLSKETLIVWESWGQKGDREVARESAAKGQHIELAMNFLTQRRNVSPKETEEWFKSEILIWVSDLLLRKQIFRATHIIKNLNLDPTEQFTVIFTQTANRELRDFLGEHLETNEQLDDSLRNAWKFLHVIESDYHCLFALKKTSGVVNIKILMEKPTEWKSKVAVDLFLKTFNCTLLPFISSNVLWETALKSNNTELLCSWIHFQYSAEDIRTKKISDELKMLFKTLMIDDSLLEFLCTSESINEDCRAYICDELAKFGIFIKDERKELKKLLDRFMRINKFEKMDSLLAQTCSNVKLYDFYYLLYKYCSENDLHLVIDSCIKDFNFNCNCRHVDMILSNRKLMENINDQEVLKANLLHTLKYLDSGNTKHTALIVLFIILLSPQADVGKILWEGDYKFIDIKVNILEHLHVLNIVLNRVMKNCRPTEITMYDLLAKHMNLKTNELFNYRFNSDYVLPHFNLDEYVQRFGKKKKVNYLFHIRHNRPSKASVLYLEERSNNVEYKVKRMALKNFNNAEIATSCIAFLEIIDIDSIYLRTEIKAANMILESQKMCFEDVVKLLLMHDKKPFLEAYEEVLCDTFTFAEPKSASNALQKYETLINYANKHEMKLPDLLLRKLAENNLWLQFVIVIQNHKYPQEQVQQAVQHFSNPTLYEHLRHCLMHDIQIEKKSCLMKDRDSRKYLLSRLGVRKTVDSDVMTSSATSQSSYGSTASSSDMSDFLESEHLDFRTDMLQILIRCHNSSDPPKALLQACLYYKYPLFAVLATSYEPDSVVTNWLIWLSVSSKIDEQMNFENIALSGGNVSELLKTILQRGYHRTLLQSFHIFLEENPLKIFVVILSECIKLNFDIKLKTKFGTFKNKLKFKRSNSVLLQVDHDLSYLQNKIWIETTAIELAITTIQYNFSSLWDRINYLKFLKEIEFSNAFHLDLPNFDGILELHFYLLDKRINMDVNYFNLLNMNMYRIEFERCVDHLIQKGFYDDALNVASIEDINKDNILLEKWKHSFDKAENEDLLLVCDEEFRQYNLTPDKAVIFFTEMGSRVDKYKALKLAYEWAYKHKLESLDTLEVQMWKAYLTDSKADAIPYDNNFNLAFDTKLVWGSDPVDISPSEQSRLDQAIDHLLNNGDVVQAFRLERLFGYKNPNLDILRLCCNLAEGVILPYQLSPQEIVILKRGSQHAIPKRKKFFSTRLSAYSSVSNSPGAASTSSMFESESPLQYTLSLIENFVEELKSGSEVGQKILLTYRISVNIDREYRAVLKCTDPMMMLTEALNGDCKNKLQVVYDFITLHRWTKQEVTDFLCVQIISTTQVSTRTDVDTVTLWDINLDVDNHLLLQLLPDCCSLLGNKLYNYASALYKVQVMCNQQPVLYEVNHLVELLVRAHDCYTADCNMEGISVILKKCRTVVNLLLTMKNWKLIVSLLTGIGRYTEMNYVFHILKQNDQFENLLRKGKSRARDNGLKVALLEYLKKFCPDNRELYNMVALHFALYSEVAQLWEEESESIVRNLIAISKLEMQNRGCNLTANKFVELTNTDGTRLCLNRAMENYTHAAEYHLQGEKLAKAMHAANQAELLALQLSLLKGLPSTGTATCILKLNEEQRASVILNKLCFSQALILVEAYNHQPDWGSILYQQFIIDNKTKYFDSFSAVFPLTDDLVHHIARRFLASNINDPNSISSMKTLLRKFTSVHAKYRIASELGFVDVVEEMLNGNQLIYLKDTVWKQGYKC